jgi:serine protease Do
VTALVVLGLAVARPAGADEGPRRVQWQMFQGGAYLGVQLEDVADADVGRLKLRDARGALVRHVERGSPAEAGGVQDGDVVVSFDGEAVRSAAQLTRLVRETPPGRKVALDVSRKGARQSLTVEVGERHRPSAGEPEMLLPTDPPQMRERRETREPLGRPAPRRLGIGYRDVTAEDVTRLALPRKFGVLVSSVEPDSPAARAGLKADDVIVSVDGSPVSDGNVLRSTLFFRTGDAVVSVVRKGETRDVVVRFEAGEGPRKM